MGIDVYMHWKGKTKEEEDAQITGFSTTAGRVGYLREAYHGGPYVTRHLVAEAFTTEPEPDEGENWKGPPIPAAVLRERLPAAVTLAIYRDHVVYGEGGPAVIELSDDAEVEEGKLDKAILSRLAKVFGDIKEMEEGSLEEELAKRTNPEQIRMTKELIEKRRLPDYALAFVDFVRLAETKEAETGEPVTVYASY